ncbi:hypothetical protein KBC25_01590 [Candidatus Pacearchaeota archaeon]|jgi:hypothetical protein|nr:hypothetical protein [Candidatus Pacearchaeota archaeon]
MSKKGVLIIFVVFLLALSFTSARNFTIYNSTNPSQAYFSIDGTTGRVGIGTMNALQGLHVIGNILANGTINATTDICIQGGICLGSVATTAYVGTVNTSMRYYVNYTNNTMRQYVDAKVASGIYDDSWINRTFYTKSQSDANLTHLNATIIQILNNGTYANMTNISYMTGINFTLQNISMRNYVNLQNTSQNYLINTKVNKSGDTMTGNLNLSANVNLTMSGGNQISSNSTCIIIKGPTSRLEIC